MISILYREEMKEYDYGPDHPFRGDRYQLFPKFLEEKLAENVDYRIVKAEPAGDEDLLLICTKEYIDFNEGYYKAANLGLSYPGEFSRFQSGDNEPVQQPGRVEEAARLIIGQAKLACDMVQQNRAEKVVSIGGGTHHAKSDYGEGFCIYNDVAFCAQYLREKYKLERVLILDTDAHAGNGTAHYFYEDPAVLFIDIHQDPRTLYPGTGFAHEVGAGQGKGFTINVPLPLYAGQESYERVFDNIIQPVTEEFEPQIIIRNGGSDPYVGDGLTNLGLQIKGFTMIGEKVREMAHICDDKVIDLILSGYNAEALPHAWLAQICGLAGIDITLEELQTIPSYLGVDRFLVNIQEVIQDVKNHHRSYWHCLR